MEPPISLEELLQAESAWREWKKSGDRLDIVAKLVAYANDVSDSGESGWVLCGVEETKDEHGVVRPNVVGITQGELNGLKGKVLDACANYVSPPIHPAVYESNVTNDSTRFVLYFHMPVTGNVHGHDTKQGTKVWGLRDSHTHEVKGEELRNLYSRRGIIPPFLERLAYNQALGRYALLDDIYMTAADEYNRQAKLPRAMADYFVPDEQLDATTPALCLWKEVSPGQKVAVPRLLAILLFGHAPTKFISGAYAIVSIYPGTDRTTEYSARAEFAGPLTKVINDVIDKLKGYMGVFMDKSRSALEIRQNRQRYSDEAIQEAVMNAFAHRDYEDTEPVRITVFSDRIEVVSPGGLPASVNVDRLQRGQSVGSRWRNASLAGFLRRMRLGVQAEGQGIPKIFEQTIDTAERPPEYEITPHSVKVTIPAYQPEPISPRPPPSPRPSTSPTGKDALIFVSIGSTSIRSVVETSRKQLGLDNAEVFMDVALPDYVDPEQHGWESIAKKIRNEFGPIVDNPTIGQLHLFYRGPVVLAPLLGALVANAKPLTVYYYEKGEYRIAYTINTKFLKSRH